MNILVKLNGERLIFWWHRTVETAARRVLWVSSRLDLSILSFHLFLHELKNAYASLKWAEILNLWGYIVRLPRALARGKALITCKIPPLSQCSNRALTWCNIFDFMRALAREMSPRDLHACICRWALTFMTWHHPLAEGISSREFRTLVVTLMKRYTS